MGNNNCFGSCMPNSDAEKKLRCFSLLRRQSNRVEFTFLVDEIPPAFQPKKRSCTSRDIQLQCLDARALLARTATSTPASSLDLEWEHETLPISLIHDRSDSSLTEHADPLTYSPRSHLTAEEPDSSIRNDTTTTTRAMVPSRNNSDSDWSRLSSENSLEWDNVQNPIQGGNSSPPLSEVDSDTQMLLSEIERLTRQTLSETGRDLFS